MSGVAILDTSWLLELHQVPGHFRQSRISRVRADAAKLMRGQQELFVTVPVLFEFGGHVSCESAMGVAAAS